MASFSAYSKNPPTKAGSLRSNQAIAMFSTPTAFLKPRVLPKNFTARNASAASWKSITRSASSNSPTPSSRKSHVGPAFPAVRARRTISPSSCSTSSTPRPREPPSIRGLRPNMPAQEKQDTHHKALSINLDTTTFGSFAEIGAGQEVARWFLRVGGASGTVAKSISAYDKEVSDDLYGVGTRYVS